MGNGMRSRDAMDYIDDHTDDADEMLLAEIFNWRSPQVAFHQHHLYDHLYNPLHPCFSSHFPFNYQFHYSLENVLAMCFQMSLASCTAVTFKLLQTSVTIKLLSNSGKCRYISSLISANIYVVSHKTNLPSQFSRKRSYSKHNTLLYMITQQSL